MIAARTGQASIALSVLLTFGVALLGPSAFQPALPGSAGQPPYDLGAAPGPHLVTALVAAAIVAGTAGLGLALWALARGWRPRPRPLLVAGLVATAALALVPSTGSGDHLSYAAYGRIAALGLDPYVVSPDELPGDPVVGAAEPPWTWTTSIYGPLATAAQLLASWIGGDSVRLTVFVMAVLNALAFAATGLLLHRLTRGDEAAQARAALLWTLNPLLLYELVAGMHIDTIATVFAVAALGVARAGTRRAEAGAGALVGLAVSVKVTTGLAGAGLLWAARRSRPALLALIGGGLVAVLVTYGLAGPHALDQVRRASKYVSLATPWHLVAPWLDATLGKGISRPAIGLLALALTVALLVLLWRALPRHPGPAGPVAAWADGPVRFGFAAVLAWLMAAAYVLPWYDGLAWALLALLPLSRFDGLVLARTALLAVAYLPARTVTMPGDLVWLVDVLRAQVVPWLLTALLVLTVVLARAHSRRSPAEPRPPAPSPESRSPSRS
ncbi:MAG: DUF2029 domain-containing protein [Streptosporangiales bacterium]|nr:DUF2029 domain-containing protein [Streptosporangiales bacterium]